MSYFKRFTDFCAGFAVFGALLHIIRNFIVFKKDEDLSTIQKVKDFFARGSADDYRAYATVAVVLVVSLFLGILLKKFPFVALTVSTGALAVIIDIFAAERLEERPMFYVVLAIIHVVGCIFECIVCDREHRLKKISCSLAAGVVTTFAGGALSIFTAYRLSAMKSLVHSVDLETFDITTLNSFDAEIFELVRTHTAKGQSADMDQLVILAVMFIVVLVVTLMVNDIFFVDLIFSAIPLISVAYCFATDVFLPQADMLVTVALIPTVTFFAATLFGARINKDKIEPASAVKNNETTPNH